MLYFHAVRGADAGAKFNNPRGAVRTQQNIPKPHRVRAVRGAVDISTVRSPRGLELVQLTAQQICVYMFTTTST